MSSDKEPIQSAGSEDMQMTDVAGIEHPMVRTAWRIQFLLSGIFLALFILTGIALLLLHTADYIESSSAIPDEILFWILMFCWKMLELIGINPFLLSALVFFSFILHGFLGKSLKAKRIWARDYTLWIPLLIANVLLASVIYSAGWTYPTKSSLLPIGCYIIVNIIEISILARPEIKSEYARLE